MLATGLPLLRVTTHAGVWGATNDDGIRLMHEHGFEDAEIDKLVEAKAVFEEHWVE